MSSRVLKKLHGSNDLGIPPQDDENSEPDSQIVVGGARKVNINPYDLFIEQSMSESEVKEDDNETEHASAATSANRTEQAKKKKKKRKKKGNKQQSAGQRRSSEDKSDMDEIIRSLKEVDKLFNETGARPKQNHHHGELPTKNATKQLLSVQHKNLNPSYEMKRMFGSRVVQAEQNKRRNVRGLRPFKSTWLVTAKENWPPVSKTGIYMSIEPSPKAGDAASKNDGLIWFCFEHNASYRSLQEVFLAAVESLDSDNIIKVINSQPYHVDSLIQLSELCKMSEDHAMASELIEHAILALETSFHSMFSLTAGYCRLDYRRQENRALFVTLFKHAQYLEGRACPRTALEVAKLILSFDPENDPLAMILVIDYFALRAQQYEWLIQLYEEWEITNNLSQLPNMAYSYAMALFYHHTDDNTLADAALQYALTMFPGVLKPLLQELSVQTDTRANTHAYFGPASIAAQRPALLQLTALYTCRTKIVWQDPALLGWMERNVNAVLDKVDAKDSIIADFESKRSQRYHTPPKAILRHIILSDFKEKVPLEPFINKNTEPILMYDPLPPIDSINIYNKPSMVGKARTMSPDASPFSMFFQSLLPTFNAQELAPVPAAAADAAPANVVAERLAADPDPTAGAMEAAAGFAVAEANRQSFVDLRTSLNSIADAMRDFLTNIRVPERPNDADVDENETSDDEPNDYLT